MIVIFGAGVIGLFSAYTLLKKGKKVKIFDTNEIKGNSTDASVGMLAPLIEAKPQESKLFRLMLKSKRIWETFGEKENKLEFELKNNASLMIALNKDDKEKLKFKQNFFKTLGFETKLLNVDETLKIEPSLNSNIECSLYCQGQDQLNPILLKKFLIREIFKMGGEIKKVKRIKKIFFKENKVLFNQEELEFEKIIIACGAWSNEIINKSFGISIPLRPLKGISMIVESSGETFSHNLWFRNIYIAPRKKKILAIGATEEEKGFDNSVTIDEVYFLTRSIWESLPQIEKFKLKKINVGLRPTVVDGNPIIGPLEKAKPNILCNFGHYRHGILLAPISAEIISRYVLNEHVSKEYKFFSPSRFNL
ncbi:MAG: FAD-dependent oxidoreductase [Pseudomonadota bacterium]|nr:FAD-dependent oxidoreductase [Pseudomonadota bacterium]